MKQYIIIKRKNPGIQKLNKNVTHYKEKHFHPVEIKSTKHRKNEAIQLWLVGPALGHQLTKHGHIKQITEVSLAGLLCTYADKLGACIYGCSICLFNWNFCVLKLEDVFSFSLFFAMAFIYLFYVKEALGAQSPQKSSLSYQNLLSLSQ